MQHEAALRARLSSTAGAEGTLLAGPAQSWMCCSVVVSIGLTLLGLTARSCPKLLGDGFFGRDVFGGEKGFVQGGSLSAWCLLSEEEIAASDRLVLAGVGSWSKIAGVVWLTRKQKWGEVKWMAQDQRSQQLEAAHHTPVCRGSSPSHEPRVQSFSFSFFFFPSDKSCGSTADPCPVGMEGIQNE